MAKYKPIQFDYSGIHQNDRLGLPIQAGKLTEPQRLGNTRDWEEPTLRMFSEHISPKYAININYTIKIINREESAMNMLDRNSWYTDSTKTEHGRELEYTELVQICSYPLGQQASVFQEEVYAI